MNSCQEDRASKTTIGTRSGQEVDLLCPDPKTIVLSDIATALSRMPRWAGQTRFFYSVAQHSFWCSEYVEERGGDATLQLAALLHDATEAYIGDIPRPAKRLFDLDGRMTELEDRLLKAIAERFQVEPHWFEDPLVKEADLAALDIERQIMMSQGADYDWGISQLDAALEFKSRGKGLMEEILPANREVST